MKGIVKAALISATMALAGCGGGSSNSTSQFAGTWQYSSGSFLITYADGSMDTAAVTPGNLTLTRGVSADLIYATQTNGPACNFMMNVRGNLASLLPGASCTQTFTDANTGLTATITLTPTIWTLQLNSTLMNESGSGNCQAVVSGLTYTCTFTQMATLSKIGI